MSGLTFTLCEKCGRHGRFTGTPDGAAVEIGSKCMAIAVLNVAFEAGAVPNKDMEALVTAIMTSEMADVEDVQDAEGGQSCIEPELREHIAIWNDAARWTNDRAQFAHSDFHDYVSLLKTPLSRAVPPLSN